jgi:hypothetical protein
MDSQFADTLSHRLNVTGVAKCQPVNPGCNLGSGAVVTKVQHPVREGGCFASFNHERVYPMGYILSTFNCKGIQAIEDRDG